MDNIGFANNICPSGSLHRKIPDGVIQRRISDFDHIFTRQKTTTNNFYEDFIREGFCVLFGLVCVGIQSEREKSVGMPTSKMSASILASMRA